MSPNLPSTGKRFTPHRLKGMSFSEFNNISPTKYTFNFPKEMLEMAWHVINYIYLLKAKSDVFSCPVGHYCPAGSEAPVRCENGTYQDQTTQWTCKICPAGYVCDNTMGIVILDNSTTVCPMGMYCPAGTRYSDEFKCPIGTFNNRTGWGLATFLKWFIAIQKIFLNFSFPISGIVFMLKY